MRYNEAMSDRILDPRLESSPLFPHDRQPTDFWEQYFDLQDVVTEVELADGTFTIKIHNQDTGEEWEFESVRLSGDILGD